MVSLDFQPENVLFYREPVVGDTPTLEVMTFGFVLEDDYWTIGNVSEVQSVTSPRKDASGKDIQGIIKLRLAERFYTENIIAAQLGSPWRRLSHNVNAKPTASPVIPPSDRSNWTLIWESAYQKYNKEPAPPVKVLR